MTQINPPRATADAKDSVRLKPRSSVFYSAVGGVAIAGLPTVVIASVLLGSDSPWPIRIAVAAAAIVFCVTMVRVHVELTPARLIVQNSFSRHEAEWSEIEFASDLNWFRSPSIVMPGLTVLVVRLRSGKRFGIDASPGSSDQILTAIRRYGCDVDYH